MIPDSLDISSDCAKALAVMITETIRHPTLLKVAVEVLSDVKGRADGGGGQVELTVEQFASMAAVASIGLLLITESVRAAREKLLKHN